MREIGDTSPGRDRMVGTNDIRRQLARARRTVERAVEEARARSPACAGYFGHPQGYRIAVG
jgi:hypothetical protein